MKWFGRKPNETGLWDEKNEVPVPVGEPCIVCGKMFGKHDFGFELPYLKALHEPIGKALYHNACLLHSLGIGARTEGPPV